jgi:hypothetical protein
MRLYSHPGNDLTWRFPPIVESIARLRFPVLHHRRRSRSLR